MYIDYAFRSLSRVDVGSVVDVSEVLAASVFRVKLKRECQCVGTFKLWSNIPTGRPCPGYQGLDREMSSELQ
jgi:hypothetical protein